MAGSILAGTASVSLDANISAYEQKLAKARKLWTDFTKGLSPATNLSAKHFISIENNIKSMDKALQKMWSSSFDSSKKTLVAMKEMRQVLSSFKDPGLAKGANVATSSYKSLTSSVRANNIALAENLRIARQIQSAFSGIPKSYRSGGMPTTGTQNIPYTNRTYNPGAIPSSVLAKISAQDALLANRKSNLASQRQADISTYQSKGTSLSMADAQKSLATQKTLASQEIQALRNRYREIGSIIRDHMYAHRDDSTAQYREMMRNELRLQRENTQRNVASINEGYRQRREAIRKGMESIRQQAGDKVGLFKPIVGKQEFLSSIAGTKLNTRQSLASNTAQLDALKKEQGLLAQNAQSMARNVFEERMRRLNVQLKKTFAERMAIIRDGAAKEKEALQRYSQMNRGVNPIERFSMQERMRSIRSNERAGVSSVVRDRSNTMQQSKDLSAGVKGQELSQFGKYIQTAISIMVLREAVNQFKQLVTLAGSFSKEMAIVGARSSSTNNELRALTKTAMDLAKTTIFTATEIAGAMSEMAGSGMKAKAIIASIGDVSNLALATGSSLQLASDIVIQIERVYGLSADKTGVVVDMLTTAANESNMTLEELHSALKYSLTTAEQSGQSLGSLLKIQMALANSGLKGSISGTGKRRLDTLISSNAAKISATFNIDTSDAYGRLKDLSDIMGDIGKKAKEMTEVERGAAFKDVFGIYPSGAAAILMKTDFEEIDALFDKGADSAAIAGSRIKESFGAQLELTRAAWQAMQLALAENVIPIITASMEALKDVMGSVANAAKAVTKIFFSASDGLVAADKSTKDLSDKWGIMSYVSTYFGKNLSYVAIGLTAIAIGFKVAAGAAWLFNGALKAISKNPVFLIISLIAASLAALYSTFKKASDQTDRLKSKITEAEKKIKEASGARDELMHKKQDETIASITQLNDELETTVSKLDEIQQKWKDAFKDPKQKNVEEVQSQMAEANKELGEALAKQAQQNRAAEGEKNAIFDRRKGWKQTGTAEEINKAVDPQLAQAREALASYQATKSMFEKMADADTGLIDPVKLNQFRTVLAMKTHREQGAPSMAVKTAAGFDYDDYSEEAQKKKQAEFGISDEDIYKFSNAVTAAAEAAEVSYSDMLRDNQGFWAYAWDATVGRDKDTQSDQSMSAYTLVMKENLKAYTEANSKIEGIVKDLDVIGKMEQETAKNGKSVAELSAKRNELNKKLKDQLQQQFDENQVGLKNEEIKGSLQKASLRVASDVVEQQAVKINESIAASNKYEEAQKTVRGMSTDLESEQYKVLTDSLKSWSKTYDKKYADPEQAKVAREKADVQFDKDVVSVNDSVLNEASMKALQGTIINTSLKLEDERRNLAVLKSQPINADDAEAKNKLAVTESNVVMLTSMSEKLASIYGTQAKNATKFQEASRTVSELSANEAKKQELVASAEIAQKEANLSEIEFSAKASGNKEALKYVEKSREENKIELAIMRKSQLWAQIAETNRQKDEFTKDGNQAGITATTASLAELNKSLAEVSTEVADSAGRLREMVVKGGDVDANRKQVTATGGWAAFFSYRATYEDQVTSYLSRLERLMKIQSDKMPPKGYT